MKALSSESLYEVINIGGGGGGGNDQLSTGITQYRQKNPLFSPSLHSVHSVLSDCALKSKIFFKNACIFDNGKIWSRTCSGLQTRNHLLISAIFCSF
jgi:hypothetical protein